MTRFLSGYWLVVPLLLFAIVVRNWVESPETLAPDEPLTIQEIRADYYLEDFVTRHHDEDGRLEYVLSGASLSHFPADGPDAGGGRAEIVAPRIELREPDTLWTATASGGRLTRDPDTVTLLADVVLRRRSVGPLADAPDAASDADAAPPDTRPPPADLPLTLRTSNLSIALDERTVSTDDAVVLEAPGFRLAAIGLQSSIEAGKLDLRSNVTGRYDVAPPPAGRTRRDRDGGSDASER